MSQSLHQLAESLRSEGRSFAVATVVAVRGSASAKAGSKALFDETGKNLLGWVGGGCAETFVASQCLEAMAERKPRMIEADLDDEVFGLGMPCGGVMDLFIDPQLPPQDLFITTRDEGKPFLSWLAESMTFHPRFETSSVELRFPNLWPIENYVFDLAAAIAKSRGRDLVPMRDLKGLSRSMRPFPCKEVPHVIIVGSSRITEEIAKLSTLLSWRVSAYGWNLEARELPPTVERIESNAGFQNFEPSEGSYVLIASHHKGDPAFIQKSLARGAAYIGLIASEKRARLVLDEVDPQGDIREIHAPAGLDLGAETPQEIALSVVSEWIKLRAANSQNLPAYQNQKSYAPSVPPFEKNVV